MKGRKQVIYYQTGEKRVFRTQLLRLHKFPGFGQLHFRFMDLRDETQKFFSCFAQVAYIWLKLLWTIIHILVSIWYLSLNAVSLLESYFISSGILTKYKSIDVNKLRYLAIVIESEQARHTSEVIKLLQWVNSIGVKHVCLYDSEGYLKKSEEIILENCNAKPWNAVAFKSSTKPLLNDPCRLTLEFASVSDGKEGVAQAANLLFKKHLQEKLEVTESLMDEALRTVGCAGPEPDLLLVYAPVRCHLGFPAWRIRYTEIIHMGPLKSMKYGSLVKAIHRFTTVRQNYGT